MFRRLLTLALIALPTMAFAQRFGVIDTESLINSLPEMQEVKTQLDVYSEKYEADFNSLKAEMNKKYAELQSLPADTPEEIRKRRVQELQELDRKINQFRQTAEIDLQNHEETLMTPIRNRVSEALRRVGQEGDYIIIFETVTPAYIRGDVTDVTAQVLETIQMMNKK